MGRQSELQNLMIYSSHWHQVIAALHSWAPRSPDLNRAHYFLWGYLQGIVCVQIYHNLEDVHDSISVAFNKSTSISWFCRMSTEISFNLFKYILTKTTTYWTFIYLYIFLLKFILPNSYKIINNFTTCCPLYSYTWVHISLFHGCFVIFCFVFPWLYLN